MVKKNRWKSLRQGLLVPAAVALRRQFLLRTRLPVPFPAVQSMPQPPSSLLRSYRKDDRAKGFGSGCQCSVFCETNTVYLTIPMLCPVSETRKNHKNSSLSTLMEMCYDRDGLVVDADKACIISCKGALPFARAPSFIPPLFHDNQAAFQKPKEATHASVICH